MTDHRGFKPGDEDYDLECLKEDFREYSRREKQRNRRDTMTLEDFQKTITWALYLIFAIMFVDLFCEWFDLPSFLTESGEVGLHRAFLGCALIYFLTLAIRFFRKPAQFGWIVTDASGKRFRSWSDGFPAWTSDRDKATQYHRREDAESVHREDEDAWRIIPA